MGGGGGDGSGEVGVVRIGTCGGGDGDGEDENVGDDSEHTTGGGHGASRKKNRYHNKVTYIYMKLYLRILGQGTYVFHCNWIKRRLSFFAFNLTRSMFPQNAWRYTTMTVVTVSVNLP